MHGQGNISVREIVGMRLASHRFGDPDLKTPAEVVSFMGAMQAQDFGMARWAVGIRMAECTMEAVQQAFDRGDFLRTHVLRPTWHLIPAADIQWMLALTAPKIKSSMRARDRDLELTEELYARTNELIIQALEGGSHLTREELGVSLQASGIPLDPARLNHIVMRAELDAVICSGAMRGSKHTYALLVNRAPQALILDKDEALMRLAMSYFRSHNPATAADFAWWSGLPAGDVRAAIGAVGENLSQKVVDGKQYLFWCGPALPVPDENIVHLLPAFDEYIIAYRDREAVLPSLNHHRAVSSNGVFRPVIIRGGRVVGIWRKGRHNMPEPQYFEESGAREMKAFDKASARLKVFMNREK